MSYMSQSNFLKQKIKEILIKEDYEQLHLFEDSSQWESLSDEEKDILSNLFFERGVKQLKNNDNKVIQSFDLSAKLTPKSAHLFFKQAKVFSSQDENPNCLNCACQALQTATSLDPNYKEAWWLWGQTLIHLGVLNVETNYFPEADQKFLKAEEVGIAEGFVDANLYEHWGFSWYCQGKISGEACDFHAAIELYRKARELGLDQPQFWNCYGDALAELACLIGKNELFFEALEYYQRVVELNPEFYEGWLNLGCTAQKLYEMDLDKNWFDLAIEGFQNASELNPNEPLVWLKWGQLLFLHGKIKTDNEILASSLEKLERADECDRGQAVVLGQWADALITSGVLSENVGLLRKAQAKIAIALKLEPENVDLWCIHGTCLNELGLYFGDESFFHQAIGKFHQGLSLNQSHFFVWHGLALSHYAIGDHRNEAAWIEKAVRLCSRGLEFGGHSSPQFWNDWGVALMKLAELTSEQAHVEEAIQKFEEVLMLCPNDPEDDGFIDPEWLYNYGCALDFLGDFVGDPVYYEKSIQALTRALQLTPSYTHARYNLALAYSHLGELLDDIECFNKALEHFQILLNEDCEDEMGWNEWGLVFMNCAQLMHDPAHPERSKSLYEQAENKLLQAAALGCIHAYYNLACLYSMMGNFTVALHYIEKAEFCGSLPEIDDMLHDEWLDGLRNTPGFRNFIAYLSSDQPAEDQS